MFPAAYVPEIDVSLHCKHCGKPCGAEFADNPLFEYWYCDQVCLDKVLVVSRKGSEERVAKFLSRLKPAEQVKYFNQPLRNK